MQSATARTSSYSFQWLQYKLQCWHLGRLSALAGHQIVCSYATEYLSQLLNSTPELLAMLVLLLVVLILHLAILLVIVVSHLPILLT
jgi:hypothetical protein